MDYYYKTLEGKLGLRFASKRPTGILNVGHVEQSR